MPVDFCSSHYVGITVPCEFIGSFKSLADPITAGAAFIDTDPNKQARCYRDCTSTENSRSKTASSTKTFGSNTRCEWGWTAMLPTKLTTIIHVTSLDFVHVALQWVKRDSLGFTEAASAQPSGWAQQRRQKESERSVWRMVRRRAAHAALTLLLPAPRLFHVSGAPSRRTLRPQTLYRC